MIHPCMILCNYPNCVKMVDFFLNVLSILVVLLWNLLKDHMEILENTILSR